MAQLGPSLLPYAVLFNTEFPTEATVATLCQAFSLFHIDIVRTAFICCIGEKKCAGCIRRSFATA